MREKQLLVEPEHYLEVNRVLNLLLSKHKELLGARLVGMYVFGSLVTGDFDFDVSDIDLVAITTQDISQEDLERLKKLHEEIARENKDWADRIEVGYISKVKIRRYDSNYRQALISPGEPIHFRSVGKDWIINRRLLREKGVSLYGPSPKTLIDPVTKAEFKQAVEELTIEWERWITNLEVMRPRKYQAYSILTMCRILYAFRNGYVISKIEAADWAKIELPEWSNLIDEAVSWRKDWRNENVDHDSTLPETLRFIRLVIKQIIGDREVIS